MAINLIVERFCFLLQKINKFCWDAYGKLLENEIAYRDLCIDKAKCNGLKKLYFFLDTVIRRLKKYSIKRQKGSRILMDKKACERFFDTRIFTQD
jgi:hypothetical protein